MGQQLLASNLHIRGGPVLRSSLQQTRLTPELFASNCDIRLIFAAGKGIALGSVRTELVPPIREFGSISSPREAALVPEAATDWGTVGKLACSRVWPNTNADPRTGVASDAAFFLFFFVTTVSSGMSFLVKASSIVQITSKFYTLTITRQLFSQS